MENFSVSTVITLDDWYALQRTLVRRVFWSPNLGRRILLQWPLMFLGFLPMLVTLWFAPGYLGLAFIGGALLILVVSFLQSRLNAKLLKPQAGDSFLGPARFEFDAAGIHIIRGAAEHRVQWSAVQEIQATPTHVIMWTGRTTAWIFGARDLSGGLDAAIAAGRLRQLKEQGRTGETEDSVPVATFHAPTIHSDALSARIPVSFLQELGAVGKQLLLIRANAARLTGSDAAIALLGAIALAIWLPLDVFLYADPLEFRLDQAGGLALVIAGSLALAWIIARRSRPQIEYRRALLIVTASLFIAIAGSALFTLADERRLVSLLVLLAVAAYATFYFKQALRTLTGSPQLPVLLIGAVATFCFILVMDRQYLSPSLWAYAGDDDTEISAGTNYQDAWQRIQELQFDQRARIDDEVAQIAAQSAPGPQVYFVGFAGYGEQRVFAQEIELAAKRVADRYAAGKREILLVNDRRDLEKYPFATVRALDHTLESLGGIMDADDVLFLALSSHGDSDATLAVSNAGTSPGQLDVEDLAASLKKSGIRWKVIVISACYAGSFIDSLADDHTIILTAAASDRTSFGCADDRDLTYFGEAFYRDALPKSASLHEAFEAAKKIIAQRENAEGIETSNPQASYGKALEAKLAGDVPNYGEKGAGR